MPSRLAGQADVAGPWLLLSSGEQDFQGSERYPWDACSGRLMSFKSHIFMVKPITGPNNGTMLVHAIRWCRSWLFPSSEEQDSQGSERHPWDACSGRLMSFKSRILMVKPITGTNNGNMEVHGDGC